MNLYIFESSINSSAFLRAKSFAAWAVREDVVEAFQLCRPCINQLPSIYWPLNEVFLAPSHFIPLLKGQSLVIVLAIIHLNSYFLHFRCISEAHPGS